MAARTRTAPKSARKAPVRKTAPKATAKATARKAPTKAPTKATARGSKATQVVKLRDKQGKSWSEIMEVMDLSGSQLRRLYNAGLKG